MREKAWEGGREGFEHACEKHAHESIRTVMRVRGVECASREERRRASSAKK